MALIGLEFPDGPDWFILPWLGGGLAGVIWHFSDLSYWHATTKTYAYFGEFGFFRIFFAQKVTLPWPNHIFNRPGVAGAVLQTAL